MTGSAGFGNESKLLLPLRDFGCEAIAIDVNDLDMAVSVAADVRSLCIEGVTDVVPTQQVVLVLADHWQHLPAIRLELERGVSHWTKDSGKRFPASNDTVPNEVVIDVHYNGPDIAVAAEAVGCLPHEVPRWHSETRWRAAFAGFAPGFFYLVPVDSEQSKNSPPQRSGSVPRRVEPRHTVAAGSVALAHNYCGVYPSNSPGGWQIIGHTSSVLFDARREPPALLAAGDIVQFRPIDPIDRLSPHNQDSRTGQCVKRSPGAQQ